MKIRTIANEEHVKAVLARIRNRQHPAWSALHGEVRVEPLTNVGRA